MADNHAVGAHALLLARGCPPATTGARALLPPRSLSLSFQDDELAAGARALHLACGGPPTTAGAGALLPPEA